MINAGEPTLGGWASIGHPEISEILSRIGFDWIVFDMEHGPLTFETVQNMMMSMNGTECVPLVRVAWNDPVLIKRALDIGAYGIVAPWINNKEEAALAVSACKYPPKGIRGVGPRRVAMYELEMQDYLDHADEEIMVICQIETEKGANNIDEILSVEGVDAYFIGPFDLSASMGIIGQVNDPRVQDAITKVLETGKRKGVPGGIWAGNPQKVNDAFAKGFKLVALCADIEIFTHGCQDLLKDIKKS